MKQVFILLAFCLAGAEAPAQNSPADGNQQLQVMPILKETSYDFGKILQNRPVTHEFLVTNQGNQTLVIENVQASCGCTTPNWPKEPVAPQKTARIKVGFNAAAEGHFEKTITLFYNGGQTKEFSIKGDVYKSPAASAPVNSSVELLKQIN